MNAALPSRIVAENFYSELQETLPPAEQIPFSQLPMAIQKRWIGAAQATLDGLYKELEQGTRALMEFSRDIGKECDAVLGEVLKRSVAGRGMTADPYRALTEIEEACRAGSQRMIRMAEVTAQRTPRRS